MRRRTLAALAAVAMGVLVAQQATPQPETVVITLHAKPGAEAELARVIANHWVLAREMKLVEDSPHLTLRRTEEGNRACFTEIFTWRDAAIPDKAPPAIQAIWAQMNQMVEPRGGDPGLTFAAVTIVSR